MRRKIPLVLGLVLAVGLLWGCAPAATPVQPAAPTAEQPAPLSTSAAEAAPVERPTPTIREGLHASDPELVNLASGKVQLVEFFAFW